MNAWLFHFLVPWSIQNLLMTALANVFSITLGQIMEVPQKIPTYFYFHNGEFRNMVSTYEAQPSKKDWRTISNWGLGG